VVTGLVKGKDGLVSNYKMGEDMLKMVYGDER